MLALSRKVQESIVIGDNIEITILSISKDQVKLGINAPKDVTIHRKEIYIQIQTENQEAVKANKDIVEQLKNL